LRAASSALLARKFGAAAGVEPVGSMGASALLHATAVARAAPKSAARRR
jgi:hypothetical protein